MRGDGQVERNIPGGWRESEQAQINAMGKRQSEPEMVGVAYGVPRELDRDYDTRLIRLRQLGNAVVPQIPEIIGRAIISYSGEGVV